jgi:IS605 OrfB family transposase
MIVRELKLKLTTKQKKLLEVWLPKLTSVYNWALRQVELNAKNKIYFSKFDFINLLSSHSKQLGIPSHTIQGTLEQAYMAWKRCFKKISKQPILKSVRNKLNSISFPDPIPLNRIKDKVIRIPKLGFVKFYKQRLPVGQIKRTRIIRRASGWYLQLSIDTVHKFPIKEIDAVVGIDTGFKHLATLSDGTKFDNQRVFIKGQMRLAQAQRGKHKKLTTRLHERISNRRKDYNHKVSRIIVQNYSEIYITNDNLRNQSKVFGKSINDAGISQLRNFIIYKGDVHGRKVELVGSKYTTMTCSTCGYLTGPAGLSLLVVRNWECSACGAQHDRDINSAKVILNSGLGWGLDNTRTHASKGPEISRLESSGGAR